jgi:hypothetical protein
MRHGIGAAAADFTIATVRCGSLGSIFTRPWASRCRGALWDLRLDWELTPSSKTLWDAFKANTSTSIVVTLTSGSYSIVITLSKVFFNASELTPEEGQLQSVDFPFLAYHDATNTAVKIVITSPNSTL